MCVFFGFIALLLYVSIEFHLFKQYRDNLISVDSKVTGYRFGLHPPQWQDTQYVESFLNLTYEFKEKSYTVELYVYTYATQHSRNDRRVFFVNDTYTDTYHVYPLNTIIPLYIDKNRPAYPLRKLPETSGYIFGIVVLTVFSVLVCPYACGCCMAMHQGKNKFGEWRNWNVLYPSKGDQIAPTPDNTLLVAMEEYIAHPTLKINLKQKLTDATLHIFPQVIIDMIVSYTLPLETDVEQDAIKLASSLGQLYRMDLKLFEKYDALL
jgi:hypothetical protein